MSCSPPCLPPALNGAPISIGFRAFVLHLWDLVSPRTWNLYNSKFLLLYIVSGSCAIVNGMKFDDLSVCLFELLLVLRAAFFLYGEINVVLSNDKFLVYLT